MAEKKRYWLKLNKDFLKSPHIKIIKDMPNGKDYVIFYLALMLESIETVGHLRFSELVPYNEQMLASLTETNVDIVRSAVKVFGQLGLIEMLDDGTIYLNQVAQMTGKESESKYRVREYRERKRLQEQEKTLALHVTKCNDNKQRTEKKEDIYINAHFDTFWANYPKKVSKQKAIESWKKLNINEKLYQEIISTLDIQKQSKEWKKDDGQFIPYPATWLNQRRWEDEITNPASQDNRKKAFMIGEEGYVEI